MHYIGPMVNLERNDVPAKTVYNYTLDEVYQKAEKSGAKIVYCAVGTMKTGKSHFLVNLVEGMQALPSWILILSLGKHIEEASFKGSRDNVFTFSHVPQLDILSRASVAIVHGGIHTINECLMLKVPMLIYSGKKSDQNGNAARLIYYKLAYHGDRNLDTKEDIIRKIEAMDKDEEIKVAMNEIYQAIKRTSSKEAVEKILDGII